MAQSEEERREQKRLAAQRRRARKQQKTSEEVDLTSPQALPPTPGQTSLPQSLIDAQLAELTARTADQPTDSDRDIDFAYRNMSNASLLPSHCPSTGAWQWYLYSLTSRDKFLEITQKREDAKAKQAGTITSQRMEDDKRKQFAMLDRIERQLTQNLNDDIDDLMSRFPGDVLARCRTHKEAWDAYFAEHPL
jgi:hypothetical protein